MFTATLLRNQCPPPSYVVVVDALGDDVKELYEQYGFELDRHGRGDRTLSDE